MSLPQELLAALEVELRAAMGSGPAHLKEYYTMMEFHMGWTDGLHSGKRLRPLLCLLACAGAGGDWQQALPMAAALELLHNFSLIHDDIQDNSPLRRGRPTLWAKWGLAQAINAGDSMFTLAHLAPHRLIAAGVTPATALKTLEIFDRTCVRLTQGQHLDISFEDRAQVTVLEYWDMIEGKTAALLAASVELGALIAGADAAHCAAYANYGRSLGLAFQVHDDFLGIWGDPSVTGKSAASDLEKRKKSLPVVYGLERSPEFAQAYAQPQQPGTSVEPLVQLLEKVGARTYTQEQAATQTADALRYLDQANPLGDAGAAIRELTDQMLSRNS